MNTYALIVLLLSLLSLTRGQVFTPDPSAEDLSESVDIEAKLIVKRIGGGAMGSVAQAPFQVFVNVIQDDGAPLFCGGTFIGTQWVLTASHCFGLHPSNGTQVYVYYGGLVPRLTGQKIRGSLFIVNENWHQNINYDNDIALIRLDKPVRETKGVLEFAQLSSTVPDVNTIFQIQGYGITENGNGGTNYRPLKIGTAKVASDADCINFYGGFHVNSDICIADNTAGTCSGDSGGGAILVANSSFIIFGVISFGSGSCPGRFAGFTKLPAFLDWVKSNLAKYTLPEPTTTAPPVTTPEPTFDLNPINRQGSVTDITNASTVFSGAAIYLLVQFLYFAWRTI
jgi:secreted trypsin-like serine protease